MMKVIIAVVICAFAMQGIDCQIPMKGECLKVDVMKNFNMEKFAGKWYDVKKYAACVIRGRCGATTFSAHDDDMSMNVSVVVMDHVISIVLHPESIGKGSWKLDVDTNMPETGTKGKKYAFISNLSY